MHIGDIVMVVGSKSLPEDFLGRYGRIDDDHEYKVTVEFNKRVGGRGSMKHTAFREDLIKVGESNF